MLLALARPLSASALTWASLGLLAANTAYCLIYTGLSGRPEPLGQALGWSIANLLPWLWAVELGKRIPAPFAAVAAGFGVSMVLGALLLETPIDLFEASRRIPVALFVFVMLIALRRHAVPTHAGPVMLPLPPNRIAWVAAAGNYVELHGADRPMLIRAPLRAVEAALSPHGFVRIHRSTLVNRSRVARVRATDLLLDDGRSLKLGPRFRAQLLA